MFEKCEKFDAEIEKLKAASNVERDTTPAAQPNNEDRLKDWLKKVDGKSVKSMKSVIRRYQNGKTKDSNQSSD